MADEVTTLLDIAKKNGSDALCGIIDEANVNVPELNTAFARTIKGILYKTLVRTGLPGAGFRAANEGRARTKADYINRLVEAFILDASWDIDKAVAEANENGAAVECAIHAADHMEAAFVAICNQIWYGTDASAKGFAGLQAAVNSACVVDATGTGSACSSVMGVKWGIRNAALVLGNDGVIEEGDIIEQQLTDGDGNKYFGFAQSILGRVGLQVGNQYSVGRIKNLTSSKTLDDDMLSDLITKMGKKGVRPDYLYMNHESLKQLQQSRTATNPTGAPAPFPSEAFNVPIIPTTNLTETEAAA